MLSLNGTQQAIVASDYKLVSWLFQVTTTAPVTYYWATKDKNYGGNSYVYKIDKKTFRGVSLSAAHKEYGVQSPNDLQFDIINSGNTLTASDFVGASVILRLVISDGTDEEIIRTWKFKIQQADSANQIIRFVCVDFIQEYLEGDYPNTKLIRDISPSNDATPDDTLCVPLPFGTCYIPLRSVYITDARYYVLGLASHTYTITKIKSPDRKSEWNSGSYTFTQSTKTIGGVNWRVFQPIIADSNNDGTCDACGLWKPDDIFLDPLVQFSRNDTAAMTSPADIIEFVLEDMGIASGDIDTGGGSSFETAETTYTSWGLTLEGAFFYKMSREKALALLLNMCNSVLIPRDKIELHVLSKTSQKTLTRANILRAQNNESSFSYQSLVQEKSDSGYIGYQVVNMPQDNLIKAIVPAKATTDEILNETLNVSFINDSQDAQRAGSLYYQRKLLKQSKISFTGKGNLLALDPNDMITIDYADYGGSYDVAIDMFRIQPDVAIVCVCIKFSASLDDWGDLTPGAITIATDDSSNIWSGVISGPSSSVSSGDVPNQIGSGFYAGATDLWGGNVALNNAATKIVLGDLDATPKIALGASADAITHAGTEQGFFADGDGKVRFGDADGYVKFTPGSPSTFDIKGVLTASEIHIPDQDTTADSFHVQTDADTWWGCTETDFTSDNDNANAYILKNGVAKFQNVILDSSVTISDIQAGSEIAIQGWQHDLAFSVTDADTVAWGSGTITLMSGATYNIVAGNTGNMAAKTYIYLDIGTSSTVLQTTTTAPTAVGSGKILITVAENGTSQATFQVFGGIGGFAITGGDIENLSITAGEIASDAIENAKILADAVTAAKIAVSGLDSTSGDVAANHIVAGMLQTNCVTSVKILADAVTAAKIDVVGLNGTTGRIVVADATDANIVTGGINSHAVTLIEAGKVLISGGTVLSDWAHGSDATLIDGGDIYTNSVTATQIAAGTITATEIVGNTITANEIAANTITAGEIDAGTITLTEMSYVPFVIADDTLDDIADGASYGRLSMTYMSAGRILLAETDEHVSLEDALSSGRNQLNNPGFEDGSVGWLTGAGISFETSGGDGSNKYVKTTRTGADKYTQVHTLGGAIRYFEVEPGEVYEYGASAKSSNGACAAQMGLGVYDKDKGDASWSSTSTVLTSWTTIAGTYTIPAGKRFLMLYCGAYTSDGDASFDNCYFRRVDLPSLDYITDGTSYGKVALTSITAGQIVLTAGVTGSLPVANSDAKCTDANADQTSANNQAVAWLTDAGNLATLNTVNATYIDAGSITLVKCAAETTNRQFTSDANRTNIEAWQHASDATLIDGGDIYANSISVNKITSSFNPNLIPSRFADFERFDNGDTIAAYNGTATITSIGSFIGEQCLNMTATAADNHIYLGKSTTDYNIRLQPSTKYLISLYATTGSGTPEIQVYIKQDDGVLKSGSVQDITTSWARYTFIITTDANLTDSGILRLDNNDNGAVIYIDGIQVEKANAAASPEASKWTPGTLNGSQFGNLTITAGKLAINTTDALEIQAAGNIKVLAGGDINFYAESGYSNKSKINFYNASSSLRSSFTQISDYVFAIDATNNNADSFNIGYANYWNFINLYAGNTITLESYYSADYKSEIAVVSGGSSPYLEFLVETGGSSRYIYFQDTDVWPEPTKTLDLGTATYAWDTAYADDFTNVADFYQFDNRDDLAALRQIKGSGIIDPLTGYELIDDLTLPAWLLKKHNKDGEVRDKDGNIISTYRRGDVCRDPDGKPYLSLKTMISLCMGAIRETDKKVEAIKP